MRIHRLAARLTLTMIGVATLFATAPISHAQTTEGVLVCGSGDCWDLAASGGPVNAVSVGNVQDETISMNADTSLCGGHVTSTCPFADPTLNPKLVGHSIVDFAFQHLGRCADSFSAAGSRAAVVSGADCVGSHAAYIITNNGPNGQDYLSVGEANALYEGSLHLKWPDDVTYVSGSAGQQLQLSSKGGASATWHTQPVVASSPFPAPVPVAPSPPAAPAPPASPAPTSCGVPSPHPHGLQVRAWVHPAKAAGRRTSIMVNYRRRSIVSGTVVSPGGSPVGGARVCVTVRNQVLGARSRWITTVRTDARGRFSYVWRAGSSRRLWLTSDARGGRASASVLVRVRAAVSLGATPTSLFNGQVMTLTGRLQGAPLPRGALVEMQVFRGTGWETFGTANVGRTHKFSFDYRFTNTFTTFTYVFRARVPTQPGDGFAAGWSRRVPVLVSG